MEGWLEPKPALWLACFKGALFHLNIRNEELFFKGLSFEGKPHALARGGTRTVTGEHVFSA